MRVICSNQSAMLIHQFCVACRKISDINGVCKSFAFISVPFMCEDLCCETGCVGEQHIGPNFVIIF